jgi:hypothetical protein
MFVVIARYNQIMSEHDCKRVLWIMLGMFATGALAAVIAAISGPGTKVARVTIIGFLVVTCLLTGFGQVIVLASLWNPRTATKNAKPAPIPADPPDHD